MTALIKHIVVLMLENRSFDHLLGDMSGVDGLTGTEQNLIDLTDPEVGAIRVQRTRPYKTAPDPGHSFEDTNEQLFGSREPTVPLPPTNSGFVAAYRRHAKKPEELSKVMEYFDIDGLPVLATLAREFAVCERWFSSVPGPTWTNRFFAHCATADGELEVRPGPWAIGIRRYKMPTIYESIESAEKTWAIYYHDIPHAATLDRLWHVPARRDQFKRFGAFIDAVADRKLPNYSFIEPRYFGLGTGPGNDQHPSHDIRRGEELIADVYERLRAVPDVWNHTLLIITYDEHGGFYDHVPPPADGEGVAVPNPDPIQKNKKFDFRRLGVRVPAVIVSPYIARGVVDRTIYDHSSLLATARRVLGLAGPLTPRDDVANSVDHLLSRETPREDTPTLLSRPTAFSVAEVAAELEEPDELTDLQQSLLDLATVLDLESSTPSEVEARVTAMAVETPRPSVRAASDYVNSTIGRLLGQ